MEIVLIIIQACVALAMIGFILLQKSEGGGLVSQQGGNTMSKFMTRRSQADFLTRTTTLLATGFMALSLLIAVISNQTSKKNSILGQLESETAVAELKPEVSGEATQATLQNEDKTKDAIAAPTEGLVSSDVKAEKATTPEVSAPNAAAKQA